MARVGRIFVCFEGSFPTPKDKAALAHYLNNATV
jgi:hypothetical protein